MTFVSIAIKYRDVSIGCVLFCFEVFDQPTFESSSYQRSQRKSKTSSEFMGNSSSNKLIKRGQIQGNHICFELAGSSNSPSSS